ncbi:cell envelope integrity EipB family protein [Rhizobium sp. LC145]|jgi:hypothetical protein|uniref:cell envelope integrity EipB family protein n=1 Tax=Rhizobium sp. LC145 TaxID=1120688 RepID=UPI00062A3DB0|nr:cell envelope integrity EipB family protein [Rhizobium sp. LC145]KKX33658.1 ATP-binding protein [Rhizobium sp. LC145]TKT55379.1 DUF1849 family protein [Rhizobiaceae bacterium LC148]
MYRMSFGAILTAAFALSGAISANAGAESARMLVPHRAVYDLKLKEASERSGIEGMYGRMVYEFTGSACTGFTTNFRFVTRISTGEETRMTDQQTTTFENALAREFRFETKSFTDEQLDKQVRGEAVAGESGVKVAISAPEQRQIDLATSDFPTEHMLEVIENAKKGNRFFESRIFDGSENGDQSLMTTTVLGKEQAPAPGDADADKAGEFSKTPYWPVTISYFNEGADGDPTPVYSMSFKLYGNGITRDLTMDYGDFVLTGSLEKLEMLDKGPENCSAPQ